MKIIERKVVEMIPNVHNARTHSDEQIEKLMASIREFGFVNPILTDGGSTVLAGHGRLQASLRLGLETVPTIPLAHLDEAQRRAYVLADNRLAEDAGWDDDLLRAELGALGDLDFDRAIVGFSEQELAAILHGTHRAGLMDEDDAPPAEAKAISRAGDIWLLGAHRIICGDCTSPATVAHLLRGGVPRLMVTDPPYGVDYAPEWRNQSLRADGSAIGARATGKVMNDHQADWRVAWNLFPGSIAYIWHAGTQCRLVAESLEAARFEIRAQIIWVKPRFVISRGAYHHQHEPAFLAVRPADDPTPEEHEPALYAVRKGGNAYWVGGRRQSTVWTIPHNKSETGHSTQKPVECLRRPIENHSALGESVYDPFLGSGTTLIAAETTGRICCGCEINPIYVDVAIRRWQAFTGQAILLEGDGHNFDEIVEDRA